MQTITKILILLLQALTPIMSLMSAGSAMFVMILLILQTSVGGYCVKHAHMTCIVYHYVIIATKMMQGIAHAHFVTPVAATLRQVIVRV
jgi:hypothetical protein